MRSVPLSDNLEKAWRWWRRRAVIDRVSYRAWDRRPAGGPLAPYLGHPHSRDELLNAAFAEVTNPREFSLIRAWPVACRQGMRLEEWLDTPIAGDLEIRIDVATYANVGFPGVGVPMYL